MKIFLLTLIIIILLIYIYYLYANIVPIDLSAVQNLNQPALDSIVLTTLQQSNLLYSYTVLSTSISLLTCQLSSYPNKSDNDFKSLYPLYTSFVQSFFATPFQLSSITSISLTSLSIEFAGMLSLPLSLSSYPITTTITSY